jgi:hypothetical protein
VNRVKDETKPGFIPNIKEIAFLIAIYLYFMGFWFVYYYYEVVFGISLRALDLPVYFIFVYAFNVLHNLPRVEWTAVVLYPEIKFEILALYLILLISMTLGWRRCRFVLFIILLIALFPFFAVVAVEAAKVEAWKTRQGEKGIKEVTFLLKSDSADLVALKRLKLIEVDEDGKVVGSKPSTSAEHSSPVDASQSEGDAKPPSVNETDVKKVSDLMTPAELHDFTRFVDANGRNAGEKGAKLYFPKLYLLTETSTSFYVLFQPRTKELLSTGYVYQVPKSLVVLNSVRIH